MSVYTPVSQNQLTVFLASFDVGDLVAYQGITDGIENTNFFITTSEQELVLTLFENVNTHQIEEYLALTAFLNEHNIKCAHPVVDRQGQYLKTLNGKPAALIQRLPGHWQESPDNHVIEQIGAELGRMHRAVSSFNQGIPHRRGHEWRTSTAKDIMGSLQGDDQETLSKELLVQTQYPDLDLPSGIVHADLFKDNVLVDQEKLSGFIDYYFAGEDYFLYDIAVAVNDWCVDVNRAIEANKCRLFLSAYNRERTLTTREQEAWPVVLRAAALRFWLSRLQNWLNPKDGELTFCKDPNEFKTLLKHYQNDQTAFEELWL